MTYSGARLLLVNDSATRAALRRGLLRVGMTLLDEAGDGEAALELLETRRYDLLISNWLMPRMSCVELLRQARQRLGLTDLPVLVAGGVLTRVHVLQAAAAGVSGFLAPPFTPAMLEEKLRRCLAPQASGG